MLIFTLFAVYHTYHILVYLLIISQRDHINKLHLDEIDWTIDHLVRFINQVPALHDLKQLSLGRRCKIQAVLPEETSSISVDVGELAMSCPISLDLLRSMLCVISCHRLIIEKDARLLKRTTKTTYPPDNTKVNV